MREVSYFERVGDLPAAQARLENAVASNPNDADARFLLGRVLINQQQFEAGRIHLEQVVELTPRYNERIQYLLDYHYHEQVESGLLALDADAWPDAVTHFQHAAHIKPGEASAHRLLGEALVKNQRLSAASDAYLAAVQLIDQDAGSWRNLAELAFAQNNFEDAVQYGAKALALDGAHQATRRRLAQSLLHDGDASAAAGHYETLVAQSGRLDDVRNFAFILFNLERYEAALPPLQRVVQEQEDPKALRALSETYLQLEAFREAIEINSLLLELDESDRAALAGQVKAYEGLGDLEMARSFRDRLQELRGEVQ